MSVRLDDKLTRVYEPATAVGSGILEAVSARDLLFRMKGVEPFRAVALLEDYPHLWESRDDVLLLAAEEYARRRLAGESVAVEEFAGQFRQWRDAVRREVEIERRLAELDAVDSGEEPRWPTPGSRFLHYEIVQLIGRGGFSRVYLARNANLGGRAVVLKVCGQEATDEAHTLGSLQHPNIGDVLSVDVDAKRALTAICMPFCSLATLSDLIAAIERHCEEHGRMPRRSAFLLNAVRAIHEKAGIDCPSDAAHLLPGHCWIRSRSFVGGVLEIGRQLATALSLTHRRNLLHRDIKPSNVLVTASGRAILFDFNLSSDSDHITNVAGTFAYMAPEALKVVARRTRLAKADYDARSDLYSLGATLYELLSGRHPFGRTPPHLSHQAAAELLLEKQSKGPRPLHQVNSAIDRHVSAMVGRLLAFDPAERFQSAEELIDALNDLLRPTARIRRCWQTQPALRLAAGGAAIVAPLLIGGVLTIWQASSSAEHLSVAAARVESVAGESSADVDVAAVAAEVTQAHRDDSTHVQEPPTASDGRSARLPAIAAEPQRVTAPERPLGSPVAVGVQLAGLSEPIVAGSEPAGSTGGRAQSRDTAEVPDVQPGASAKANGKVAKQRKPTGAVVALVSRQTQPHVGTGDSPGEPPGNTGASASEDAVGQPAKSAATERPAEREKQGAEPKAGRREVAIRITDHNGGATLVPNARKPQPPARPERQRSEPPRKTALRVTKGIPDVERVDLLRDPDELDRHGEKSDRVRAGHDASRRVYLMALTAESRDDYKRAISLGEETLLEGYDTQALRNNLGYCYWKLGDLDKALAQFELAIEKKARNPDHEQTAWINWAIAETDTALRDGRSVDLVRFARLNLVAKAPIVHVLRAKALACSARRSFRNPKLMKAGFLAAGNLARQAANEGVPSAAIEELADLFPELLESRDFQQVLRTVSVNLRKGEVRPVRLVPVEE